KKWWPLPSLPLGGTKGWMSDAGGRCMLRTGQSLLASALGRIGDPVPAAHARCTRGPRAASLLVPRQAEVHCLALAAKVAGKDMGMWFGPASAIRCVVSSYLDSFHFIPRRALGAESRCRY
ncbi:hypothetical protein C8R44DRAFT_630006, partial [Mycena epipterygia]